MDLFNEVYSVAYPLNVNSFMVRYKYFGTLIELALAVVSKTLNRESHIMKVLKFCWYAPLFMMSRTRREAQFKAFVSSGDLELVLSIAKASGNDLSRFAYYFINPSITTYKKIYIPKNYERLTSKGLNTCLEDFLLKNSDDFKDPDYKFTKKLRGAESFENLDLSYFQVRSKAFKYKYKRDSIVLSKYFSLPNMF